MHRSIIATKSSASPEDIRVISFSNTSAPDSTHYLHYPVSDIISVEELECHKNTIDYTGNDSDTSNGLLNEANLDEKRAGNRDHEAKDNKRRQNVCSAYKLSQIILRNEHNMHRRSTLKTNNGEPVIIINNLSSKYDVNTMVDDLMSKKELSDVSSIYVVVPTSDDNQDSDSSSDSHVSTICIQMSKDHSKWNNYHMEVEELVEIPSGYRSSRGLRVSVKGQKFLLEGLRTSEASFHNIDDTFKFQHAHKHKHRHKKKKRSKNCQMWTPEELLEQLSRGISTDTTEDRPCCCSTKRERRRTHCHKVQTTDSNHVLSTKMVSELITPLLVTQGLTSDVYRRSIRAPELTSFLSAHQESTTTCQQTCDVNTCCSKPEPPTLEVPNENSNCKCSPAKLLGLLADAMDLEDPFDTQCTGSCAGEKPVPPTPSPTIDINAKPDCPNCTQVKEDVTCACWGKKKKIKFAPKCPCEIYQPPISATITGPKADTVSLGCQCCTCDPELAPLPCEKRKKVLGPDAGCSGKESDGTYTQAGLKQKTSSNTTSPKGCVCKDKPIKKDVMCECPPDPEPEPKPEPIPESVPEQEPEPEPRREPEERRPTTLEEFQRYQHENLKQHLRRSSQMTHTHSGFKMHKKKKLPPPPPPTPPPPSESPQVEVTIEDVVRYYAAMKPELFQDLIPTPPPPPPDCPCEEKREREKQEKERKEKEKREKKEKKKRKRNAVKCQCPSDLEYQTQEENSEYSEERRQSSYSEDRPQKLKKKKKAKKKKKRYIVECQCPSELEYLTQGEKSEYLDDQRQSSYSDDRSQMIQKKKKKKKRDFVECECPYEVEYISKGEQTEFTEDQTQQKYSKRRNISLYSEDRYRTSELDEGIERYSGMEEETSSLKGIKLTIGARSAL